MDPNTNSSTPTVPPPSPSSKQGSSINKLLLLIIVILLVVIISAGAYFLGMKQKSSTPISTNNSASPTVSSVPTPIVTASVAPSNTPLPKIDTTDMNAGVTVGIFSPYKISVINDWNPNRTTDSGVDKLVISKGAYILTIVEGGGGGGICTYPGDAPQQFSQSFSSFTDFGTDYRRSFSSDTSSYTICQKNSNGYGFPTKFGYITYTAPGSPDATILSQMDSMVASIVKQ